MGPAELDALLRRFERGIEETTGKFRSQGMTIVIGSAVVALIAGLRQIWFLVPVCLGFGAALFALGRIAARNSGPDQAAPVLEALRIAPGRITHLSHKVTSDSKQFFVTHWIEVRTADGRLFVRADPDWRELFAQVERRCPQAVLERGPAGG